MVALATRRKISGPACYSSVISFKSCMSSYMDLGVTVALMGILTGYFSVTGWLDISSSMKSC